MEATANHSGIHMSSLFFWSLASMAGAALLWLLNQYMAVIAREVAKRQGGDAIAERINNALNLLRHGLQPQHTPPHYPYGFYVGNAIALLIVLVLVLQKIVFFSVGDPYTAMLHAVILMLMPLLFPIVSRRWRIIQNEMKSFMSGLLLMLTVFMISGAYTTIVAFIVENIVR
jgi:hypothetical protein